MKQPIPKYQPEAEFSNEVRRLRLKGQKLDFAAFVSFVVDTNGKPQDVCLMQSAGHGLDANADKAIERYRFEPATMDGKPVAIRIFVQVNFRAY